ncbi:MAG: type IV pilin N-terminal domain-containing protein [Thermoplasmata archaeon]|nr:type IV pilin N-terminal domain-containing protein [Thermoplasmata archaeon]
MKAISSERQAVSPVIAVVLLVAITTVLAAVVYVTVSSMIGQTEVTPYMYLSSISSNSTTTIVSVTAVESKHLTLEFMAILIVNGTTDQHSTMRPIMTGTVGNLTYVDLGDEKLSIGDEFRIDTVPGRTYELVIVYLSNGNKSGSAEWET